MGSIPVEADRHIVADIPAVDFDGDNTGAAAATVLDPVDFDLDHTLAAWDIVGSVQADVAQLLSAGLAEAGCCHRSIFYTKSNTRGKATAGKGSHLHLKFKLLLLCNEVLFVCYLEQLVISHLRIPRNSHKFLLLGEVFHSPSSKHIFPRYFQLQLLQNPSKISNDKRRMFASK